MLSSSPLKPSVPSASLLRFLRSQSDYFTANPSTCPRSSSENPPCAFSLQQGSNWTHLDAAPCRASVEANLFGLPSLSTKRHHNGNGTPSRDRQNKSIQTLMTPSLHSLSRAASTRSRPLLRRLFDLRRNKAADANKANRNPGPPLIDHETEGTFSIGRGLVSKATNELRLRCTEFDINGNVTLVNGEFRKSELIAKVGL